MSTNKRPHWVNLPARHLHDDDVLIAYDPEENLVRLYNDNSSSITYVYDWDLRQWVRRVEG